jgi:hypothetical protein
MPSFRLSSVPPPHGMHFPLFQEIIPLFQEIILRANVYPIWQPFRHPPTFTQLMIVKSNSYALYTPNLVGGSERLPIGPIGSFQSINYFVTTQHVGNRLGVKDVETRTAPRSRTKLLLFCDRFVTSGAHPMSRRESGRASRSDAGPPAEGTAAISIRHLESKCAGAT